MTDSELLSRAFGIPESEWYEKHRRVAIVLSSLRQMIQDRDERIAQLESYVIRKALSEKF